VIPILFSCHAPHIALMRDVKTSKAGTSKAGTAKGKKDAAIACPICGKPADAVLAPFCSKRGADVDLHRWFSGRYVVPVTEDEEEDERRDESDEAPQ
jgi:endogenous inhibitor of DNA gyrase (YacG/DUF329 family)